MPQMATKSAVPTGNIKMGLQAFLWVTWYCHLDSNLREKPKFLSDSDILAPRRQERQVRKFILFLCGLCVFAGDNPNLGSGAHAKFFVLHTSSQETQNSHKNNNSKRSCD